MIVVWVIWKQWKDMIFQGKEKDTESVFAEIHDQTSKWWSAVVLVDHSNTSFFLKYKIMGRTNDVYNHVSTVER